MNIPGIYKIEYILPGEIDAFDYSPGDTIDISAYNNGTFTELVFNETASLNSSMNKDEAGILYEISTSFRKAGKNSTNLNELVTLARRDHIYRMTDVNGKQYLIGTTNNPAKFQFEEVNDQDPTGYRGYNCSISWRSVNGIIYLA
ncbi:MAG: hypothetical protein V5A51_08355 [Bacteroidales bacterium]